jgi:hypothetical protein
MPPDVIEVDEQSDTALLVAEATLPAEPSLRAIADDVSALCRYAFLSAETQATANGNLDQLFRNYLATRGESSRLRYRAVAQPIVESPQQRATQLGRFASLDLAHYRSLGADGASTHLPNLNFAPTTVKADIQTFTARLSQLATTQGKSPNGAPKPFHFDPNALKAALEAYAKTNQAPPHHTATPVIQIPPDLVKGLAYKKMRVFIRKVRCIEETDEIGSDEINMGGTVTAFARPPGV